MAAAAVSGVRACAGFTGDTMKDFRNFFADDAFAALLGMEFVEASEGSAAVRMKIGDVHLNSVGTVHGGVVFSLADAAFAVASNSHDQVAVAINASISYVKAATGGVLTARAVEQSLNPRLATYAIDVRDGEGDLVASFQGMVYRKRKREKTDAGDGAQP
jgi:acyl-CoA thioesterase